MVAELLVRITRQIIKERLDAASLNCLKVALGKVVVDENGIRVTERNIWKNWMNEENEWDLDV